MTPDLDRAHEVRPGTGMCAPGFDDGIDSDVELARHLGGASPPQVLDQLGRVGGFHRCNARQPSSAASVEPSEEMGGEEPGGEGGGNEESGRDLQCGVRWR
jgi:hypothetical protein